MARPDWDNTRLQLIETYKMLNNDVRPKDENDLTADRGGSSVFDVVRDMKNDELLFAKALTERLTGEIMGTSDDEDAPPVIGNEVAEETTQILISQFGSARATTLNTMQTADDEAWERPLTDNKKMLDLAKELAESDRVRLDKIRGLLRT
jgi:hypothetical protein